ncbi:RTA1 domain-containing [Pyrenophora seminiperda CCB06]|uniref:RTA1 domain-containing n=1 Tax=Pyrenophora seminiperda CCB06 TaxID=1302712 RepID=A0A3M7M4I9_9PLEO|nr:RTA1 domain-containing [Pyrenophora seminiperda CCB06]
MKVSLALFSALLLPLLSVASPAPATPQALATSQALPARGAVIAAPSVTASPVRRDDYEPSIPPLSLDLPVETCTPGFPSYATPGLDGYVPAEACNALWVYFPNFAAAVAFSVLFGMLTIAHLCQAIMYRNGFCWVIIMAALWETGAYAFRALGSKNQQSAGIATVAQILVLVAPIWVNAFAYMVFARIVWFYSPTRRVGGWKWLVYALYGCLLAITIRIIYRLAEFSAGLGTNNPLPSNEPVLYVLESTPMWLAILVWNIVHPGRFINGPDAKMPRSWLSRHLCCCCGKRRCDDCSGKLGHAGPHHHPVGYDSELEENREMGPVSKGHRGRVTTAPANPFLGGSSRDSSPNGREQVRLRPPPAADNYREVSPDPPYTAYRPRRG